MITNCVLALLGLYTSFIRKYLNRTNKNNKFSFKFWFKDNWPELTSSLSFLIALMIILSSPDSIIDFSKLYDSLPINAIIKLPSKMVASFLSGFFINEIIYWMFKKKMNINKPDK